MAGGRRAWYGVAMNLRVLALLAGCLTAPIASPVLAQLVHLSLNAPEALLLFKADRADIPLNTSPGFVTELDLYFDSRSKIDAPLDPRTHYWHMRVENPVIGQTFNLVRPFQTVLAGEQSLTFIYNISEVGRFENMEINLFFAAPIETNGSLPQLPWPALGETEYSHSDFRLLAGTSMFNVPHLTEVYGQHTDIDSYTVELVPIPEPAHFALVGLLMIGVAAVMRDWRRRSLVSAWRNAATVH